MLMTSAQDVMADVNEALPFIREAAVQCDLDRAVPAESIALLERAGVFRILQPSRYGGTEGRLQLFFDAIAAIGSACTSTGWVAGVLGTHQWVLGHFPQEAQDDVWKAEPRTLMSGSASPASVTALRVAGGYRVSGTWRFCSGSNHATWHFGGATISNPEPGTPDKLLVLLPVTDVEFVDNWIVNGLRGTASRDGIARDVFVPEHRVLAISALLAGKTPGQRVNSGALFRLPNATVVALGIAAPPIGATASALAGFIDANRTRERTGGLQGATRIMAESPTLQLQIADAATRYDAVRALIERDLEETQRANEGGALTVNTRVRVRRDLAFAVQACVEIVGTLYQSAGTTAMFTPNSLERTWRDVTATGMHVGLRWDNLGVAAGRHLFGLEPNAQY
jgi:alkylation response protein AidB-like acyl-CoA dehydrogenase